MKIEIFVDGIMEKEVEAEGSLSLVEEIARALRFINIYMECVGECIGVDDWKVWFEERLEKIEDGKYLYFEEEECTEYLFEISEGGENNDR